MQSASAQPAAVLDYAAAAPPNALLRRLRLVTTVLGCVLTCGLLGWIIDPSEYRAVGLLQVDPPQTMITTQPPPDITAVSARQAEAVTALNSPANLNAAVALLPPTMKLTPSQVAPDLKVSSVPDSRLIVVSFIHDDSSTAAAVVNAVMAAGTTPQFGPAQLATPPLQRQHNKLFPIGGLAVGLLLGVFTVARRWK